MKAKILIALFLGLAFANSSLFPSVHAQEAADDYFLRIDGITGESTDDAHPNEIEVDTFQWGVLTQATESTAGGAAAGRAQVEDLSVTMRTSQASPDLMLAALTGERYESAVLTVRRSGESARDYLRLNMTDVFITSQPAVTGSPSTPVGLCGLYSTCMLPKPRLT